ncbi:MAG TPA: FHA domain-containing protein, partial [Polyangiales bacterium]
MTRSQFSAWGAARLYIEIEHAGGTRARLLPASDEIWIGSAPSCHLVLEAPEIAPRHLSIFSQRGKLFVRDHAGGASRGAPLAIRRLTPPAAFQLGPYRLQVQLVSAWSALRIGRSALKGPCWPWLSPGALARWGWRRRFGPRTLLAALSLLGLALVRALLYPTSQPPVAAAACAVEHAGAFTASPPRAEV